MFFISEQKGKICKLNLNLKILIVIQILKVVRNEKSLYLEDNQDTFCKFGQIDHATEHKT